MKKLLTILGSIGLMATTSAAVIACGDKSPSIKSNEEIKKDNMDQSSKKYKTEESKKEDRKEEKEIESKFSEVDNKLLGNFEPNNKNMVGQGNIKKELAKRLSVSESDLQGLNINYEEKKGEVTLPRFDNKKLKFTFTRFLQLGKIKIKKTEGILFISHGEIKKELAKRLSVSESDLQELKIDLSNDISNGSVRSKTFVGTLEFKFEIEEK
ncbi:lipoprotein [Mycoplasma mycoides subsp. capri]|uniref:lipoprotein n=1 Tax=Mycoplasma mycoides TaxID=2102 RepID=UPI00223FDA33|nr:lipoprotein [Mycoplasma mycoides]QVJ96317.1 lipoprotein [Mycoplasma mycoides subsp. capri]QVJ97216.1 lipoprotein [Mycoplasma mycoides subsp. capri]QVK00199.1 lipoprotein [Mycoplasma mycoides subsp. capri]QVK01082.1 lipoprotein [Mycoplasma mycoides subsp. capri]